MVKLKAAWTAQLMQVNIYSCSFIEWIENEVSWASAIIANMLLMCVTNDVWFKLELQTCSSEFHNSQTTDASWIGLAAHQVYFCYCNCVCGDGGHVRQRDAWRTCVCVRTRVSGCTWSHWQSSSCCVNSVCGYRCGVPSLRPALHHRPRLLPVPPRPRLFGRDAALRPRGHRGVCQGELRVVRVKLSVRACCE